MSSLRGLLGAVFKAREKVSREKNPIQFWTAVGIGLIGLSFGIGIIYAAFM
jgi:hypothetical protein